ncbi:hypothetical protein HNP81_001792 [Peribacillus huizhouensis]|uniref:Uncharacterized protein n=1 Tax=Peribacillus huizhouensis TaxID=1501239 RepID=A0ABR6CNA2_9BACI|nr:hypothetical protein [Peribacillus huizhouensis]
MKEKNVQPLRTAKEIAVYTAHMSDGEYLFTSRKGKKVRLFPHKPTERL